MRRFEYGRRLGGVILLCVVLTGCDRLLEVENPGVITSDAWNDPANAPLLFGAALGDFECMFPTYIRSAALMAHELMSSGVTGDHQNWAALREMMSDGAFSAGACGGGVGFYTAIQDARFMADEGYRRISTFSQAQVPEREAMLAALAAYGGYSYTLMGEGMCESVIDGGPIVTPTQLLTVAEERFTSAIQHAEAAMDNSLLNTARVGRARVRLNLGKTAAAVADASLVPEGFVRFTTHSDVTARRRNTLFTTTHESREFSVHFNYHNLTVGGVPDPRVQLRNHGTTGSDNFTPQWSPQKYSSRSSPVPFARWEEAQLIIAEVQGGQAAVDIINRLRQKRGLPLFSSNDPAAIAEQVREERRRELFLESHRLNDMLRWGLPFPTGLTHKGQPYGSQTCVPLPAAERDNNPNIR